ncbi:MAG: TonB family protein [Bacteroidales bacterium]
MSPTRPDSAWPAPGAYRVGRDSITPPAIVHQVNPNYTADALRAGIEGNVVVECLVRVDGTVGEVRVVRSLDRVFGLDDEAVKAAKQWRFAPTINDTTAVPVLVPLELSFKLRPGSASSSSDKPAQATTPNRAAMEAARELVDLAMSEQTFDALVDQMSDAIAQVWWATAGEQSKAEMAARGVKIGAEDEARMKVVMKTVAGRVFRELFPRSEFLDSVAPVYARTLSADDMNEIIRFYKTPVGSKALGLTAKMMVEGRKVGESLFAIKSVQFQDRLKAELMKEVEKTQLMQSAPTPVPLTDSSPTANTEEAPKAAPLNSWKTAKAGMKAEIDGNVMRMSSGEGWVRTRNEYLDFVFRVRYRVMTDDAEGALLLRAWKDAGKDWPTAGYRLAINGAKGKRPQVLLGGISGSTQPAAAAAEVVLPPAVKGQWRAMEVTCRRDRVTVRIDGRQITDIQGHELNAGLIGIEARKGTIEYEGMSLAPLASTWPASAVSQPASSGVASAQLPLTPGQGLASQIKQPVKIKDVRPRYPEDAQNARIQGTVILEALISPAGKISLERILQSVDHNLDLEAIAAVRQWEFTPTLVDGVAVPVIMTVTVRFSLE